MIRAGGRFEPLAEKALELTIELRSAVESGSLDLFEGLTAARGKALESLGQLLNTSEDAVALRSSALWLELARQNDDLLSDLRTQKTRAAEALGLSRNRRNAERQLGDEGRLIDRHA